MKRTILLILALTISRATLAAQDTLTIDPYWAFDSATHYRPRIDKGDFYRYSGVDFISFMHDSLVTYLDGNIHQTEKLKTLSYGQKSLLYWWWIIGILEYDGGLSTLYSGDLSDCMPAIIKSMEYIGAKHMAQVLQRAHQIVQHNQKIIDANPKIKLLATAQSDLYYVGLDTLDEIARKQTDSTSLKLEQWIRAHPDEFCTDERGFRIVPQKTGKDTTFYATGSVKLIVDLQNGAVNGVYRSFYRNGNPDKKIVYRNGRPTGERIEWYENGNHKYAVQHLIKEGLRETKEYYENGVPKLLQYQELSKDEIEGIHTMYHSDLIYRVRYTDADMSELICPYHEWYDNGQLAINRSKYTDYELWEEYHRNGIKKSEAISRGGKFIPVNAWNEQGGQTLSHGTGYYTHFEQLTTQPDNYTAHQYLDSVEHGLQSRYEHGRKVHDYQMHQGKYHGYSRRYYSNGNIREETIYDHGKAVSTQIFPVSERPKGKTYLNYTMTKEWLERQQLPLADRYATCINEADILKDITCPDLLLQIEYQNHEAFINVRVNIDSSGKVTGVKLLNVYLIDAERFLALAQNMQFSPAMKDNQPVPSSLFVTAWIIVE